MSITDDPVSPPRSHGTKRRGSIDEQEDEEEINTAPDIVETSDAVSSLKNSTETTKVVTKKTTHRRRATYDGASLMKKFKLTGTLSKYKKVIDDMQNNLPTEEQQIMINKSSTLKLERELKHTLVKLRESEDNCKTAVEIIGNLKKENEDLRISKDTYSTQYGASQTEIKILEQKLKSLDEQYRDETNKYKDELNINKKKLDQLQDDMTQKDLALNEAKEYQKSIQQKYEENEDDISSGNKNKTLKEKKLYQELQNESKKLESKDLQIQKLLSELNNLRTVQKEKENLENELSNLNQAAQNDILDQNLQIEKMTQEIIQLSARNSSLEREKDDLINLLEERDYENQMLKTGYGLHRSKTNKISEGLKLNDNNSSNDFTETLGDLVNNYQNDDDDDYYDENDEQQMEYIKESRSSSPKHGTKEKVKQVADVTREYLHLTASVVKMKFPQKLQHITSEELIKKVRSYQFWEYHDMMVMIMKTEEQKIIEKEKKEKEARMNAMAQNQQNTKQNQQRGMLWSIRSMFGGGNTSKKEKRKSMMSSSNKSSNKSSNNNNNKSQIRQRNNTTPSKGKPPSVPSNKKPYSKQTKKVIADKKEDVTKMLYNAKDKINNRPTEDKSKEMAQMDFASVPDLNGPKKPKKVKKPNQKL